MKKQTTKPKDKEIVKPSKLYVQRANMALPILVRQATAGTPIFYSDLAKELGMPNSRNLNYVLGEIGDWITELEAKWGEEIPKIQNIVINKQTELSGNGINAIPGIDINSLTTSGKKEVLKIEALKMSTYPYWNDVLTELGLKPLRANIKKQLVKAGTTGGTGESEQHKKFKNFIKENPFALKLKGKLIDVNIEYQFPSADTIDVLFTYRKMKIGVEVKSTLSNQDDILRGIFQCVKYLHLIEAEQKVNNEQANCRVILALEGKLPSELIPVANVLNVEVIDEISMHP